MPSPEPVSPEPVSPEPVSPEPVSPKPVGPEPVSPALRVVRIDRGTARLSDGVGERSVETGRHEVAVGDWVHVVDGHVRNVVPRRSALVRSSADRTSREQVLAANIDDVVVVEPLVPRTSMRRIERLLVLAWSSGARPVVVLSKHDAATADRVDVEAVEADVRVAAPGADVLVVSAVTQVGLEGLRRLLGVGRTIVLLGPSGAGKSSLLNALAGGAVEAVGELRADGKGRHTTAWRHLVEIPGGPTVIDTPGLRAVGLVGDAAAVDAAFADIAALAAACRFRDCAHVAEPGCAVSDAVADGSLAAARYDSWRRLRREVAYQERRGDARLEAAERARWKALTRAGRARSRP
jgi:ribosome biogenesis GTPase